MASAWLASTRVVNCLNGVRVSRVGLIGSVGLGLRVIRWTLWHKGGMLCIWLKMQTVDHSLSQSEIFYSGSVIKIWYGYSKNKINNLA